MSSLAAPTWRMTTLLLAITLAFVLFGGLVSAKDGGPGDLQDRIIKLEALTDQHSQQIAALQAALDAETAARIAAVNAEAAARAQGDANAIANAKTYTDGAVAAEAA